MTNTNATRITARPQRSEDVPGTLALTFLSHRADHAALRVEP